MSTNEKTHLYVWMQEDDQIQMRRIGPLDLTLDRLRTLLNPYYKRTGPGRPGRRIEVLKVNVEELSGHIGPEAAKKFADGNSVFESSAALSHALGYSGNKVAVAIKKAKGTSDRPTLRGVSYRYHKG